MQSVLSTRQLIRLAFAMYFEPIHFSLRSPRDRDGNKISRPLSKTPIRSLFGEGITIRGEIDADDHGLRIDGHYIGDIACRNGLIVISETALIEGNVDAGYIIVNGRVKGNLKASNAIELQPKAVIDGDVYAAVFEMHQGAAVRGKMEATEEPNTRKFDSLREEARRLSTEAPKFRLVK